MRRNCCSEESVAAGLATGNFAHGLGLRVGLHIFLERQLWHLILAEAVDIAAVEAGGRGGGHDHFGHAVLPAALNHIQGALVVDASVQLLRVKGPHGGCDVKHAVHALARRCHCLRVAQVAHNVFNVRVIPRQGRPVSKETRGYEGRQIPAENEASKRWGAGGKVASEQTLAQCQRRRRDRRHVRPASPQGAALQNQCRL